MKTYPLIAAAVLTFAASGAALAEGGTYEYPQPTTSATSRAAVVADLLQARANGTATVGESGFPVAAPYAAQARRADVRAQTVAAYASGEAQALASERGTVDSRGSVTVRLALAR